MAAKAVKKKTDGEGKRSTATSSNTRRKTTGSSSSTRNAAVSAKKKASGAATKPGAKAKPAEEPEQMTIQEERTSPLLIQEAMLWSVIAVGIFLFISNFGFGGFLGGVLSDVGFGIFGWMAYLFPIFLVLSAAFLASNRGSAIAGVKFISAVILYLTVCSFFGLAKAEEYEAMQVAAIYERSAAYKNGGGAVGGFVCRLLTPALGTLGAGVFLAILAIICVILITQRSIMRGVKNQSKKMYRSAKENSKRRREAYARERELMASQESELMLDYMDLSPDPARADGYVPFEEQQEKRRGLFARKVESCTAAETRKGRSGRDLASAMPEHAQIPEEHVSRPASHRTTLEVPVIFPSTPQPSRHSRKIEGTTTDIRIRQDADETDTVYQEIPQPEAEPEIGLHIEGLEKSRKEVSSDAIFSKTAAPKPIQKEDPEQVKAAQQQSYRADMSELQADVFADDLFSDQEDPWKNVKTATVSDADLSQKTEEDPKTESRGQEEAGPIAAGRAEIYRRIPEEEEEAAAGVLMTDAEPEATNKSVHSAATAPSRSVTARSDFGIFAEEGKLDNTSSGHMFREAPVKKQAESRKQPVTDRTTDRSINTGTSAADGSDMPQESSAKRNPRSSEKEIQAGIANVEAEAAEAAETVKREYIYPPLALLKHGSTREGASQEQEVRRTAAKLQQTLDSFGVHAKVTNVSCGPSVTRYELMPEQGVKVKQIVALSDDIKLNLAAADIRIEAPIPGKSAVGIEVPNGENSTVMLRDLLETDEFEKHKSNLAFAVGKDIGGKTVVADIAKMPHLLIAGATGSGKSVCINTLIMSILYKAKPEDVKLIMIDPKVVELSVYNGIPHLFIPVVTDPKKAAGALNWAVAEMTDRYNKFAEYGVRDLKGYNQKVEAADMGDDPSAPKKLPQIVIIVDELADLMMVAPGEVEDSICRLAQLARAAGLHLIIATQRPSVNVITGLIKANMPSRIAFSVSSGIDSRTIIDMYGAEKLLGKGDMLFYPQGYQKPARVQGAFVSDEEVSDVVDFLKEKNTDGGHSAAMEAQLAKVQQASAAAHANEDTDALFAEAGKFIIEKDKASIGMLQRVFKIGFNRAARIMDQLSDAGVVGPEEGTKPRKILMSEEEFENYLEQN